MGKSKESKNENDAESNTSFETSNADEKALSYEEKLKFTTVIAKPMASRKMAKKLYKLIKKARKEKKNVADGLKTVQLQIRKGETGIVVLAGDITPIDMVCHIPAVCEEKDIPYIYTPSRVDLGLAMGLQRPCIMLLIKENEDYKELYDECYSALKAIPLPI